MTKLIIPDVMGGPMHPVEIVYPDPSKKPQAVREEEEARGIFTKKRPPGNSIEVNTRSVSSEADKQFAEWAAAQGVDALDIPQGMLVESDNEEVVVDEVEEVTEKKPAKGEHYVICEFCEKEYHRNGYSKHVKSCQRKARDEHIC